MTEENHDCMAFKDRIAKENRCLDTWQAKYGAHFPPKHRIRTGDSQKSTRSSRPATSSSTDSKSFLDKKSDSVPISPKVGTGCISKQDCRRSWEDATKQRLENTQKYAPGKSKVFAD
mmetsp:Transcript_10254/g.20335  ORF Transcript_10254/g.20335 Transcript_10254/m.20335 type:complete len:117 (-) Transcript_10254:306-656(-)